MHEVSLCRQLAASVTRATTGRPGGPSRVEAVYVTVGELRQVVPEALEHAWTFVVRGTALAGARLVLHQTPAVVVCDDCAHSARLPRQLGFTCCACGSAHTHLTSGEELVLTAVDVDDPPAAPAAPHEEGVLDGTLSPS